MVRKTAQKGWVQNFLPTRVLRNYWRAGRKRRKQYQQKLHQDQYSYHGKSPLGVPAEIVTDVPPPTPELSRSLTMQGSGAGGSFSFFGGSFSQFGKRLWNAYMTNVAERPLITGCLTSATMYGVGDFLAQNIEEWLGVSSPGKSSYNYMRTVRMVAFGGFFAGPCLTLWYPTLHKMTTAYRGRYAQQTFMGWRIGLYKQEKFVEPSERFFELAIKVMCENLFFQPPFITLYLVMMGVMEGNSSSQIYEKTKMNFHDVWSYSFLVWVPAQSLNFWLVPVPLQAFCTNCTNCVWKIIMSLLYHRRDYGPEEHAPGEQGQIRLKDNEILRMKRTTDHEIATLRAELAEKEATLASLQQQLAENTAVITEMQLKEQHMTIERQQKRIEELEVSAAAVLQSLLSWQLQQTIQLQQGSQPQYQPVPPPVPTQEQINTMEIAAELQ